MSIRFNQTQSLYLSTVDSTTSSTGSIVLTGGLAVQKNMVLNQSLTVGNSSLSGGTIHIRGNTSNGMIRAYPATNGAIAEYASMRNTDGSTSQAGDIWVFGHNAISCGDRSFGIGCNTAGIIAILTPASEFIINGTLDSTAANVGAFRIAGGAYIAKKMYIGGAITIADTTDSTTTSTGAIICSGGVGIAKRLNVGATTDSTSLSTGALICSGGAAIAKNLYLGGTKLIIGSGSGAAVMRMRGDITTDTYQIEYRNSSDVLNIRCVGSSDSSNVRHFDFGSYTSDASANTWNSRFRIPTSATNGSIAMVGPASLSGDLTLTSTTNSVSAATGAIVCSGGAAIAKTVNISGGLAVNIDNSLSSIPLYVFDSNNNGGDTPAALNTILMLKRNGFFDQSYSNVVEFKLGRYASGGADNAFTQLNIAMNDGLSETTSTVLSLRANGNIGIGTTSPISLLEIQRTTVDSATNGTLCLTSNLSFGFGPPVTSADYGCSILFRGQYAADLLQPMVGFARVLGAKESSANYTDGFLAFSTNRDGNRSSGGTSALTEKMRITSDGNVGIGTTTPSQRLQVAGSVVVDSNLTVGTKIQAGTAITVADYNTGIGNSAHALLGGYSSFSSTLAIVDPQYQQSNSGGTGGSIGFYGQYKDFGSDYIGMAGRIRGVTNTTAYGGGMEFDGVNGSGGIVTTFKVSFDSVTSLSTIDATATNSGSLICAGGIALAKNIYSGGTIIANSSNVIGSSNTASSSNSSVLLNGTLSLNNGTSNTIFMGPAGFNSPTTTTRSTGTKIVLFPSISSTDVDYAIGIGSNTTWISTPNASSFIRFYHATTNTYEMSGTAFSVKTTTDASSTSTGALICSGGVGIAKNTYIGGNCSVTGTLTKGTGSFLIKHPQPSKTETHNLRHSFVETNTRGDNIYRYKVKTDLNTCTATIELPEYFPYLNENVQVFVSPTEVLCCSLGKYDEAANRIYVMVDKPNVEVNVLVIGTRKDSLALQYWPAGKSEEEPLL